MTENDTSRSENIKVLKKHYGLMADTLRKGKTEEGYSGALRLLVSHRSQVLGLKEINDSDLKKLGTYLEKFLESLKSSK